MLAAAVSFARVHVNDRQTITFLRTETAKAIVPSLVRVSTAAPHQLEHGQDCVPIQGHLGGLILLVSVLRCEVARDERVRQSQR